MDATVFLTPEYCIYDMSPEYVLRGGVVKGATGSTDYYSVIGEKTSYVCLYFILTITVGLGWCKAQVAAVVPLQISVGRTYFGGISAHGEASPGLSQPIAIRG